MSSFGRKKLGPKERALFRAVERKDIGTVARLLGEGIDPNIADWSEYVGNLTILICAAGEQFLEGVELLLKAGADPNSVTATGIGSSGGESALFAAIGGGSGFDSGEISEKIERKRRLKIVDHLLKAGASLKLVYNSNTPLSFASGIGELEVITRLIDAGANPAVWPSGSIPPLNAAAGALHENNILTVRCLVDYGAPIDSENPSGTTPLIHACYSGIDNVVDFLVGKGADVNHKDGEERRPITGAAWFARQATSEQEHQRALKIVKRLIEAGANVNVRDGKGKTPFEWALMAKSPIVADYLKSSTQKSSDDKSPKKSNG